MSSGGRTQELLEFSDPRTSNDLSTLDRRMFSRSQTYRNSPASGRKFNGNATFLTECSFGVAHDRLVHVITDVEPFEPHWEELRSIDLSGKEIDSAARLKEFLPKLDTLNLSVLFLFVERNTCLTVYVFRNSNQLTYLSGVPGSVRTLSVSSNRWENVLFTIRRSTDVR